MKKYTAKYKKPLRLTAVFTALAMAFQGASAAIDLNAGRHATVGAFIYDLRADTIVLADNADVAMTPASILKSLTTATALSMLGKDYRFATVAALSGSKGRNGVWKGNLQITPSGDPTLESPHFKDFNGICDSIVSHLKAMGVRTIEGRVSVADTVPDQGQYATWENMDTKYPYGAGWYNVNWNDNTFRLWPASGKTEPYIPDLELVRVRRGAGIERGAGSERLYVYGRPRKNQVVRTTIPVPRKAFEHALSVALSKNGIAVEGKQLNGDKREAIPVYVHRSPELGEIMRDLMWRSDNLFAEGTLRAIAPGQSLDSCLTVERNLWEGRGLDMTGQSPCDGSGLARVTSVTPRFIGNVLIDMSRRPEGETYVSLFPMAGSQGSVRNFLKNSPLQGYMALKSGSMSGVKSYAGYALDENGRPTHVVVLMANRFSCSTAALKAAMEQFLTEQLHGHCAVGAADDEEYADEDGDTEDTEDNQE